MSSVATTFDAVVEDKPVGLWRDAFRRMRHNPSAIIGATIVGAMVFMAVLAPFLAPYDPLRGNLSESFLPPSAQHWGARLTLGIAVLSVTFGVIVGGFLGAIAGFFKGAIDGIIMRTVDIMLAIPGLLLAIGIVTFLGRGVVQIAMAIAIVNVPVFARLLPNAIGPLIVQATLALATAVVDAAALGFLGLGPDPRTPEWGAMLSDTYRYLNEAVWLAFFPGLMIVISVVGFNLLGDGMREALDPKLRR